MYSIDANPGQGAPTPDTKNGILPLPFGLMFAKGISMGMGPVAPNSLQEPLRRLIESGVARPSFVFGKGFKVNEAPQAFRQFSNHEILKPFIRFDGADATSYDRNKRLKSKL